MIVTLNEDLAPGGHAANRGRAARLARALGASPRHSFGTALFGFAGRIPEGRLEAIRNDPRVAHVTISRPVRLVDPATGPNCVADPDHPDCTSHGSEHSVCEEEDQDSGCEEDAVSPQEVPWGYDRIGADLATGGGAGVHVFVFDTGIDSDHPDLADNLAADFHYVVTGTHCQGLECHEPWDDDNSHGSHVAGTIGAADNDIGVIGVAHEVTLHAVKVLNGSGGGSEAGVIEAVDWLAGVLATGQIAPPVVVNMSFQSNGIGKTGTCTSAGFDEGFVADVFDPYHEAICNLARRGAVIVAAAGNGGDYARFVAPATYDDAVITVSATTSFDDWPSWSNYGADPGGWTFNASSPVALAAPGDGIRSTLNKGRYGLKSGTSMATAQVSGAVALYLAPRLSNKRNKLLGTLNTFQALRDELLDAAEDTGAGTTWSNTSFLPHAENFLDVRSAADAHQSLLSRQFLSKRRGPAP